jgi:hypothetical protein
MVCASILAPFASMCVAHAWICSPFAAKALGFATIILHKALMMVAWARMPATIALVQL